MASTRADTDWGRVRVPPAAGALSPPAPGKPPSRSTAPSFGGQLLFDRPIEFGVGAGRIDFSGAPELPIVANHIVRELGVEPFQRPE